MTTGPPRGRQAMRFSLAERSRQIDPSSSRRAESGRRARFCGSGLCRISQAASAETSWIWRPGPWRSSPRFLYAADEYVRSGYERVGCELGRDRISVALAGYSRQPVRVIDPAIESHYGTGYERSRLFPGGNPSLEFVRSMELLDRLLPRPPARLLDVGGGPGTYAAPLARRGYRVHLVDPLPLHVEQARQAAGRDPASGFTAAEGDARELSEQAGSTGRGADVRAAVSPDRGGAAPAGAG